MSVAAEALRRWREHPAVMVRELFGVTPDAWQDDVLEAFPSNPLIAMLASKGPGKAQPKETIIPVPAGLARFGDLKPGDQVFAADGMPTRIRAVYDRGVLPVYRVSFNDGSSTLACGEHLWKVRGSAERARIGYDKTDPESGWAVLSTEQIIARGVRNKNGRWQGRQFEIPIQGKAHFQRSQLPLDPYLLGVWLGDGTAGKGEITSADGQMDDLLAERGHEITRHKDGLGNDYVVRVRGLYCTLREVGILALRCHEKSIPAAFKIAHTSARVELLCGLMDTDGCIDKDDGHTEFATTSKQLADDVVWLARSLGGVAFIKDTVKKPFYYSASGEKIAGKDCYRVSVALDFAPFYLAHKACRWKAKVSPEQRRYLKRYIDAIEPVGEADCMCIEVEHPSRCYLTNDFIVTHNTGCEAWLAWNYLLTRPHPNIAACSITAENLADNLWKEMAKWQAKSPLLQAAFEWKKTRIESREHPATWWMSARSWPRNGSKDEQANTLAGLHADYVMFILDESGGIPDAVLVSAEAALSSCVEGHLLQGGNPTHREGALFRAHQSRDRWRVFEVNGDPDNPKRSPRVGLQWARDQIAEYGRDNPWVLVNVFGQFPPGSINTLIGEEEIDEACRRSYRPEDIASFAKIVGVDVARFGDDASVAWPRQGLVAFAPRRWRNLDSVQGGGAVAGMMDLEGIDAAFVDDTGGYGAGWIDHMRLLGKAPVPVAFSGSAIDRRYANKRAEIYFEAVKWIRGGGQLPPLITAGVPELKAALSRTTYTYRGDQMLLEPKDMVKQRLGYSPDDADAFCLTFSQPVAARQRRGRSMHRFEYDPFPQQQMNAITRHMGGADYDPVWGQR